MITGVLWPILNLVSHPLPSGIRGLVQGMVPEYGASAPAASIREQYEQVAGKRRQKRGCGKHYDVY
jgi:hypothetical protein